MPIPYRNRAHLMDENPKVAEALDDICNHIENVMRQNNVNLNSEYEAPPPPSGLKVTASGGIFDASITDNNPVTRGINYFLEYSPSPSFNKPTTIDLGQSRNHRAHLGNQTLYWRAHSSYPTSKRSPAVYHGTSAQPTAVIGGGTTTGPALGESQGSGTSNGAQGSDGAFGNNQRRIKTQ